MDVADNPSNDNDWFPPLDAATQALQDLYRTLNPTDHVETYLNKLCQHAVELVDDADMAGVTVFDRDGNPSTAALTSPTVRAIDELQYLAGVGPCLEAVEKFEVVVADQDAAAQRWPGLAAEAKTYGVVSFLSVPLPPLEMGVRTGAVNLYGTRSDGFARAEVALTNLFTTAAGYAIMSVERYRGARNFALQLERALDSRAVIDQAKGVLMAVHAVDSETAFRMLVETSQESNKKVRLVAEELLASLCR
ncbi:GAF and ANTAR domain-containing protein [Rhodococcus sp. OK302]|uniref:GAF and ANTAR domain-containing protein n=1 Tax=Rhodococcus sp. OK302 TaxID=1882769 RepID=UPI000B9F4C0E|nr:GAF and ANTAR domain-containing protein [Rhodococcus sp. OK302]OYD60961.1 GAF domain-containing protein [Rhodococcus sp. OK302]